MKKIILYADGGCRGNQFNENVGAWAYHLSLIRDDVADSRTKSNSGIEKNTTNNRMELTAVIEGLKAIKDKNLYPIQVFSDSEYVVNGATVWFKEWERKGWKKIKNRDLWQELLKLIRECKDLIFTHVSGHCGIRLNELVDKMCNDSMDNRNS